MSLEFRGTNFATRHQMRTLKILRPLGGRRLGKPFKWLGTDLVLLVGSLLRARACTRAYRYTGPGLGLVLVVLRIVVVVVLGLGAEGGRGAATL